jgi:opacity protein-like surface antigen
VKVRLVASAAAAILIGAGSACAGDAGSLLSAAGPYNWSGFYGGVAAGAAFGHYNQQTSTIGDGYMGAAQAAAVTAAGAETIKPSGFTTGVEGGYNWQVGNVVFGFEADLQAVHLNGATSSGLVPYPGAPRFGFTVTSYANSDWLLTARPRVGFVAPNHWLFYATGGLAVAGLRSDFSFIDNAFPAEEAGKVDAAIVGYAAGGGIEAPLMDRLSLKAEYLHVGFPSTAGAETANNLVPTFPAQVFTHSSELQADIFRVGLNYRFGETGAPWNAAPIPLKAPAIAPPLLFTGWQVETGVRLWLSSGSIGAPQPLLNTPGPILASRLIYSDLNGVSGETFARVDHSSGVFVKGNLGAGAITNGKLNDEDFPAGPVYSNTLSNASGHIGYATIDLGYDVFRSPNAKLGPFVGYNYYTQAINTYGCSQVAGSTICAPAFPSGLLGLTENDAFNSLRVGLSSEVMITNRLRLTVDAAYLPVVTFSGLDNHLLRQLLLPEASGSGDGVMFEAVLDYNITDAWRVGVGGRYWAWNVNTGTATFDFLGVPGPATVEPARFTTERYGVFLQSSYRWDDSPPLPYAIGAAMLTKAPIAAPEWINWSGFYIGGNLGGGFSDGSWADPFPSTIGPRGFVNVAGFGDETHATGPLGGGQIRANWQIGHWVVGVEADAGTAHIRGENTCFSGIGGINCMHQVNAVASVTGRAGFAWDRSLLYVKGGGAGTDVTYSPLGNTNALALGTGRTTLDLWGWTAGAGIEYALTNHWTTFAEYDHIGLPTTVVPFPSVAVISANTISVRQSIDLFKLGVNYKFDLASLAAAAAAH